MNRDQKAAVIEEVAGQMTEAQAVFAVDYRGISVPQAAELRDRLREADAAFRVVKNTLTERAADQAGAVGLKPYLAGPTAVTFVRGDAALAAKALADFRRANNLLDFKGGWMNGDALTAEQVDAIARLPSRDVLYGRLVGMVAAPLTGLAGGLNNLVAGLARQLALIAEQGLVPAARGEAGGEARSGETDAPSVPAAPQAEATGGETAAPEPAGPVEDQDAEPSAPPEPSQSPDPDPDPDSSPDAPNQEN